MLGHSYRVAPGRRVEEVAPCGDAFDHVEEVEYLGCFERRAVDAGLLKQGGGVEEAAEVEAAAAGEHRRIFARALLLLVDPGEVGAGFEREHPGAAERREGTAGDVVTQAWPLERSGAGFVEWRAEYSGVTPAHSCLLSYRAGNARRSMCVACRTQVQRLRFLEV